jgi:hypothetical protein
MDCSAHRGGGGGGGGGKDWRRTKKKRKKSQEIPFIKLDMLVKSQKR